MTPEVRAYIEQHKIYQSTARELGTMLPEDDAELDAWITAAITARNPVHTMFLVIAAQGSGRSVDARHLARGAVLMQHHLLLGTVAYNMQGDVATAAAEALLETTLSFECQAMLLLTAAGWCRDKGDGNYPPGLRSAARRLARMPVANMEVPLYLIAAAQIMEDEAILSLALGAAKANPGDREKLLTTTADIGSVYFGKFQHGVIEGMGDKPNPLISSGQRPMRYSATISGKASCPCGSGKKYKRCCILKDRDERSASGDFHDPGISETHLNNKSIARLSGFELSHLDPLKLRPEVLDEYFIGLTVNLLWDVAVSALQKLGYRPELDKTWQRVLMLAAREGKKEIVEQVLAVRRTFEEVNPKSLPVIVRLLLLKDDPAAFMELADQLAYWTLKLGDEDKFFDFASGLLNSSCSILGILAARSFIPLLPRAKAQFLFDEILRVRDLVQLPPDDDFADILEKRFADELPHHGKEAPVLREAQRRLEAKASEVRQLRSRLDHLHHEVGRLEAARHAAAQSAPATPAAKPAAAPADETTLRELRRKVEEMKALLQERHEERTALRRELHTAQETLEKTRTTATSEAAPEDAEEAHFLPAERLGTQPLRVPHYPRNFHAALHILPPATARHALTDIARLATGEAEAFTGVVRLKALPDVFRLRIGSNYRLLFRLHAESLEIVDLINRRDLEKRIRSLQAAG